MDYVLVPIARCMGLGKRKATIRFAEQAWLLIYYSVFWTLGMVCFRLDFLASNQVADRIVVPNA